MALSLKKITGSVLAGLAVIVLVAASAFAEDKPVSVGNLMLEKAIIKATPPGAPVAGGFLVIHNKGDSDDRLVGAKADFAGNVQAHEMSMQGDVMTMQEIEGGLVIPAGGEAVLKPGGNHLMFMELKEQMKEGETRKVTLRFEKAGEVEVDFPVGMPIKPMN